MKTFLKTILLFFIASTFMSCSNDEDVIVQNTSEMNFSQVAVSGSLPLGLRGHQMVQFNSKLWIIGGTNDSNIVTNTVLNSTDGIAWSPVTTTGAALPARSYHKCIVFNNKLWVIGGYDGSGRSDIYSSTDGINWVEEITNAAFGNRYQ
jgi:hypothetical protein